MASIPQTMTVSRETSESRYGDFKPVVGTTGATLQVLERDANHPTSMKLLSDSALRPLSYQEILPLLMKDEGLRNALKGKWFWLAGEGTDNDGLFTVDDKGELKEIGKRDKLSLEQKVRVWSGNQPLSFGVYSDDYAADFGGRFVLYAVYGPHLVAPLVVGVPVDREAVAQKSAELRALVRQTLPPIIAALEPSSNNAILESLRRIQKAASE